MKQAPLRLSAEKGREKSKLGIARKKIAKRSEQNGGSLRLIVDIPLT
jgi:hypothetical protein